MKAFDTFFAGGVAVPCDGESTYPVTSPVTGEIIGQVRYSSADNVDLAVEKARAGYRAWKSSSVVERKRCLREIAASLQARTAEIAQSLADEIGCPTFLGEAMQVGMAIKGLELAAEGIDQIDWEERVGNGLVQKVGIGVVAALTPWNFPLHQIVAKIAPVIAAGCAVVLKPSEVTPTAARIFAECVHASSLPDGVFNLVWGGREVGEKLTSHPGVDHVSFTGSTLVGMAIMTSAAQGMKRVTLELGGKSAAVILDDADLDQAIPNVVRMSLANSGQTCVSQSRIIVPQDRFTEIVERYLAEAKSWRMGDPAVAGVKLGPVATKRQYLRIREMIDHAKASGAEVKEAFEVDAALSAGFYIPPTLVTNVDAHSEIAQQEVFGPVVCVIPYKDEAEAITIANSSAYGLSGAVWSQDTARATRVAEQLETGQVIINGAAQNLATPFGGWKESGFGRENGKYGIEDLLTFRSIHGAA